MTQKDDDGFFVGYINAAPGSLSWFLPVVAIGLVVLFAAVGYLTAAGQKSAGSGAFLWGAGQQKLTGVLQANPYPVLHARPSERFPNGRTLMLNGQGKRGVASEAAKLDGQVVEVSGILLKRGELDALQVGKMEAVKAPDGGPQTAPVTKDLGRWRIAGEICDGKCVAGAMRPGTGLAHKACANFCLLGGVPPVFVATDKVAGQDFMLLGNQDGGPLRDDQYFDFVAQPVEIEGHVEQRGDLLIFKINPATTKPL
jgi:hypothetical protein